MRGYTQDKARGYQISESSVSEKTEKTLGVCGQASFGLVYLIIVNRKRDGYASCRQDEKTSL